MPSCLLIHPELKTRPTARQMTTMLMTLQMWCMYASQAVNFVMRISFQAWDWGRALGQRRSSAGWPDWVGGGGGDIVCWGAMENPAQDCLIHWGEGEPNIWPMDMSIKVHTCRSHSQDRETLNEADRVDAHMHACLCTWQRREERKGKHIWILDVSLKVHTCRSHINLEGGGNESPMRLSMNVFFEFWAHNLQ